jgi:hypothetical protein
MNGWARLFWVMLLACCAGAAQGEQDEPWQHLEAPQIRGLIIDARVRAGEKHYRFAPDGGVLLDSRRTSGRWRLERDELCFGISDGWTDECFEVQRRGSRLRFLQDGYVVMEGDFRARRSPP